MSARISLVINVDTRPGVYDHTTRDGGQSLGTRSIDYIKYGVENKLKFFSGHEVEVHLFVDVHESLNKEDLWEISQKVDNLVLHKHVEYFDNQKYFPKHNDLNFLNALSLARGEFIAHFDGDMAAFKKEDSKVIDKWLGWLSEDKYDYVSYPSPHSPRTVRSSSFTYDWASTRFFLSRRRTLDYTEILKCLEDRDYLYSKYTPEGETNRCGWLEHVLGLMAGRGRVFYPPMDINDHLVFSWSAYTSGILEKLNNMPYKDVLIYVVKCGGIFFPCDVTGRSL